ncbi:MAG: PadR family transcriptional regulator [Spirochaetaceae bacterium]|jgi:DNA-binding PadR family transcriptional regulator|nr:PadR family transcriptional regulator [Spirochaetaceae bacterium]
MERPAGQKKLPEEAPELSSDLLRGHTETIVLGILHKGDAYGFEIYNSILERTGEKYELKETTLYSSYKRLEQEGCITSYWGDETQGARRRYYHLTGKGRETYRKNMRDWEFTRTILDKLMKIPQGS